MLIIRFLNRTAKASLYLLCLTTALPLFAQDYEVKWGPVNKKESSIFTAFRLIGLMGDSYIVHIPKGNDDHLVGFNLNHELEYDILAKEALGRDDINFRDIIPMDTGSKAIFFDEDKDQFNWKMWVAPFEDGKFGKLEEKFSKSYDRPVSHYPAYFGSSTFRTNNSRVGLEEKALSNNLSHIAIVSRLKASGKAKDFAVAIIVMDKDFNIRWDRTYSLPVPSSQIVVKQVLVADDGDVYLLIMEECDYAERKSGKMAYLNWSYSLLHIQSDSAERLPIAFQDELFPDALSVFLSRSTTDQYMIAGLYSHEESFKRLEGVFLIPGQDGSPLITPRLFPFDDKLLAQLNTEKEQKRDEGLSGNFVLDGLTLFENGNFALVAERRFTKEVTRTSSTGSMKTTVYYYSHEILIPVFTNEGNLITMTVLDKHFVTTNVGTDSYTSALFGDKLYFIFTNYKTKEEREELKQEGIDLGYYSDLAIVDAMGTQVSRQTLFTSDDYELYFAPTLSDSRGSLFLLGTFKMNKFSFGILDLNK